MSFQMCSTYFLILSMGLFLAFSVFPVEQQYLFLDSYVFQLPCNNWFVLHSSSLPYVILWFMVMALTGAVMSSYAFLTAATACSHFASGRAGQNLALRRPLVQVHADARSFVLLRVGGKKTRNCHKETQGQRKSKIDILPNSRNR